jgi:hypothetical protein
MSSNLSAKDFDKDPWKRVPETIWKRKVVNDATRKCMRLVKEAEAKANVSKIIAYLESHDMNMDKYK